MNDTIKAMLERRSVRNFKPDMPPAELIDEIMKAGLYAANGRGRQKPVMIAVTDKALRDEISADNCRIGGWPAGFDPFYGAPAMIIVLAPADWPNRVYDGSLVMGNLMLAAHALGLDSIWIHRAREEFEMPRYKALVAGLGLKGDWEGIGHCALGYRASPVPEPAPRLPGRIFWKR